MVLTKIKNISKKFAIATIGLTMLATSTFASDLFIKYYKGNLTSSVTTEYTKVAHRKDDNALGLRVGPKEFNFEVAHGFDQEVSKYAINTQNKDIRAGISTDLDDFVNAYAIDLHDHKPIHLGGALRQKEETNGLFYGISHLNYIRVPILEDISIALGSSNIREKQLFASFLYKKDKKRSHTLLGICKYDSDFHFLRLLYSTDGLGCSHPGYTNISIPKIVDPMGTNQVIETENDFLHSSLFEFWEQGGLTLVGTQIKMNNKTINDFVANYLHEFGKFGLFASAGYKEESYGYLGARFKHEMFKIYGMIGKDWESRVEVEINLN